MPPRLSKHQKGMKSAKKAFTLLIQKDKTGKYRSQTF